MTNHKHKMLRIIKTQKVELLTSIYLSVLWPISLPLFSIKVFDDVTIEQHAALMRKVPTLA